ncbi:MAG: helicase [Desulfobulbus propionicus]|nr:MAG: helicase [Desulfobulbus propionicus]
MSPPADENQELYLAEQFAQYTGCNIFLTGKAGTGKTTFLLSLSAQTHKRLIITAPTGVAAINAGGVTLHSFFQLPFGLCLPDSQPPSFTNRFSTVKRHIITSLDLLVIDEISMVRADVLDGVDQVLRRFRRNNEPFGGVQLLMIGDLHQLSPVVKDSERALLDRYYETPYFFSSMAFQKTTTVPIELEHIYRQSDNHFIHLLNRVRDNNLDHASLERLNTRYKPNFTPDQEKGYISLCTHNAHAESLNNEKLHKLPNKAFLFEADLEGQFPEQIYPTAASLTLKKNAQVMFIRNDPSPEKRYFNGKIGRISTLNQDRIEVTCADDPLPIKVERTVWENIEYDMNHEKGEVSQKVIGTFKQYPLKTAWAITVHKSQGMTFDRAVIDLQSAFAHGQVYVALSRCRSLEGIVLSAPLQPSCLQTNHAIQRFLEDILNKRPNLDQLRTAKIEYQQQLLLSCFSFRRLGSLLGTVMTLVKRNSSLARFQGAEHIQTLYTSVQGEICTVGEKFKQQLKGLFTPDILPGEDPVILERLTKAAAYFTEKIEIGLVLFLTRFAFETDNREVRKRISKGLASLEQETAARLAGVQACGKGFDPSIYLRAVSIAMLKTEKAKRPVKAPTYQEADLEHIELFEQLKQWRKKQAEAQSIPAYQVIHLKVLLQIAIRLPDTLQTLQEIKGIGQRLSERYGEQLVALVGQYRQQHNIDKVTMPTSSSEQECAAEHGRRVRKKNTHQVTLELFQQGLSIAQIAAQRGLVVSTIENHCAGLVEQGEIAIGSLLEESRLQALSQLLVNMREKPLNQIKASVNNDYSYHEIKLVLAHLTFLEQRDPTHS